MLQGPTKWSCIPNAIFIADDCHLTYNETQSELFLRHKILENSPKGLPVSKFVLDIGNTQALTLITNRAMRFNHQIPPLSEVLV